MIRREYCASSVKLPFWFMEFRKEVELLAEGKTFDDINEMNNKNNIFGAATLARARNIYCTVTARIKNLDSSFYPIFKNADVSTQKLFALSAVMAQDTLFFDFVYEVIREKMLQGTDEYSDLDIRVFFRDKQVQDEKVSKWAEYTIYRLGVAYKNYLSESGMTDKGKPVRKIYRPIVDPTLEKWLGNHDMKQISKALNGER